MKFSLVLTITFFHKKILTFTTDGATINEGSTNLIRPNFSSVEEMNETIIERHNAVVGVNDKVYFLGDVGFSKKELPSVLSRLNGQKRLILGNHDYTEKSDFMMYFQFFEKIMESRRMGELLFTHRPVLIGESDTRIKGNVHGHIHEKNITDPRYINISMEQIDYIPVSLDWIINRFKAKGITIDAKL